MNAVHDVVTGMKKARKHSGDESWIPCAPLGMKQLLKDCFSEYVITSFWSGGRQKNQGWVSQTGPRNAPKLTSRGLLGPRCKLEFRNLKISLPIHFGLTRSEFTSSSL